MSITERLSPVLSSIEFQLARSLPVLDKNREIVFFYKTREIDSTQYIITDIKYVVYRDVSNGKIKVMNAVDMLPEELLGSIIGTINQHKMEVEKELEAEDEYLMWYERLVEEYTSSKHINGDITRKLAKLFSKLEDGATLKVVYSCLAEDFIHAFELH